MGAVEKVRKILAEYDRKKIVIATVCSHSSLQIFHGARAEGFKTLGITVGKKPPKYYDAFPLAKPDEFMCLDTYKAIREHESDLVDRNVIVIPHGSFVEYMGAKNFNDMEVPTFGNRAVLGWESDRDKERQWLQSAGVPMPRIIDDPVKIDKPVLVKFHGAKGGKGFFIAKDYKEFMQVDPKPPYHIQEYVVGTRYYMHFFYSPITSTGYKLSKGSLELLSMDRRDESNIDEMYKLGSQEGLKEHGMYPTFVVTGNVPIILRESLLPKAFDMGERTVERSLELFGGMLGPFCLETIVTDKLEFKCFEVSSRIVAGTNLFPTGSPYSDYLEPQMSTGRRIAREIKNAIKLKMLDAVVT
jgi:5-formaminoimidazole-4-carboxamide-1-(beta)-D-ribofuranosyl 5'-monophosphate synthetase